MDSVNKSGKDPIDQIPDVIGCRTNSFRVPLERWRKANPGVRNSFLVEQAVFDALTSMGFTRKRDERPK